MWAEILVDMHAFLYKYTNKMAVPYIRMSLFD